MKSLLSGSWSASVFLMYRMKLPGTEVRRTVYAKILSQGIRSWFRHGVSSKRRKKATASRCTSILSTAAGGLGIQDAISFLDRMIVLDYIIANEDRHFNNFGALREAETLQWIGFAPIYDSGSSLGYDKTPMQIRSEKDIVCKPFKNHHAEQLKLVTDFSWINFERLEDVDRLIESVLTAEGTEDYMDEVRIRAITESVRRRIENLFQFAMSHTPTREYTTEDDVEGNIAADYASKVEL